MKYLNYLNNFEFPKENEFISKEKAWQLCQINNTNILISSIESQSKISFCKEKLDLEWVKTFHISNVVKLKNFQEFCLTLENIEFGVDKLAQFFLMWSCCIFSHAAETRFMSHNELLKQQETTGSE